MFKMILPTDYKTPVLCGNGKTATMTHEAINSGKKIIGADKIMELSKPCDHCHAISCRECETARKLDDLFHDLKGSV